MNIEIIKDKNEFYQLKDEWNNLLKNFENSDVQSTHQWYNCWINSFITSDKMLLIISRESEALVAAFPAILTSYKIKGVTFNTIKSMTNHHSLQFDYISNNPSSEQLGKLLEKAFEETKYNMMIVDQVSEKSNILEYLSEACKTADCNYLIKQESEHYLIKLENSFDGYFNKCLKAKFRKNVRAAERKALKRGPIKLLEPKTPEQLENFIERIVKIEELSWKGKTGSALAQDKDDLSFFIELSRVFFNMGWLNMSLIQSGTDDIAYFYCIGHFDTLRAMRIAMNEQFRDIGPGMINIKYYLEKAFKEKKFKVLSFGGTYARYKNDWGNKKEKMYKIFIFKNTISGKILFKLANYYKKHF